MIRELYTVTILLLLICGALGGIFIFIRLVRDPTKVALYLTVLTAPITRSLGHGAFLQRITISDVIGGVFIFTWCMNKLIFQRHRMQLSSPLNQYIIILLCAMGLSFLVNWGSYGDILQGVEELTAIFYLSIFYFVLIQIVVRDEDIQRVLGILLLSAVFVVGIGLWDSAGHRLLRLPQIIGPVNEEDQYRIASTFRTTGQLGVYLLSTFFVALAYYFLPDSSRRKRIGLVLLMVGILLLSIFACRRSVFAAFLVGLAVFLTVKIKNPRVLIPGLIICVIGFAAVVAFLSEDEGFLRYFQRRTEVLTPEGIESNRFIQLQQQGVLKAFMENPLAGIGIGGFHNSKYSLTGNEVHSTYGQLLAETGVLGLTAYALFMLMLLKLTYETGYRLRDPKWSIFCSIIFAAFFGFGVSYAYNRHLRERTFWILVGLIVCMQRMAKARLTSQLDERRKAALARKQRALPAIGGS